MRYFSLLFPAALLIFATNCSNKSVLDPPLVASPSTVTPPTSNTVPATSSTLPVGSLHPMAYPELIVGQTDYTSTLKPENWLNNLKSDVNLSGLVKVGESLKMIALGGSLTAGVQNGGLYRESQLTAYPNLVAKQLGITDFQSPVFGTNEANGTGFMLYADPTAPYPTWKLVQNSLAAIKAGDPPVLSPYTGNKVSNFAAPGLGGMRVNDVWNPNASYDNGTGHLWLPYQLYLWRFLPSQQNQTTSLIDYISQTQSYNLFLLEDGIDSWFTLLRKNDNLNGLSFNGDLNNGQAYRYLPALKSLVQGGKKGVIFTIPNFQDMAFMNWYTVSDLKGKASKITISYTRAGYSSLQINPEQPFALMPTPAVASIYQNLKKGDVLNVSLTDADVMDAGELSGSSPELYNSVIRQWAKQYNLALVDLNSIYKNIKQNNYVTDDGYRIDGSPKGNFYSSDGINPTAVGQAVIANEVIKALNNTYQANIPLINVQSFVGSIGLK